MTCPAHRTAQSTRQDRGSDGGTPARPRGAASLATGLVKAFSMTLPNLLTLAALMILLTAPAAVAQTHGYDHNGSDMQVTQSGNRVSIVYNAPRAGLRVAGVVPGTELFSGTVQDGYLSGLAQIFRSGCGVLDFFVYGDFRLGQAFTLTGAAPVLAPQGCAVVDNVHDGLNSTLRFVPTNAAALPSIISDPAATLAGTSVAPGTRLCVTGVAPGSALNLRVGPGQSFGVIARIGAGDCAVIAGPRTEDGWQAVHSGAQPGWASQRFLRPAP